MKFACQKLFDQTVEFSVKSSLRSMSVRAYKFDFEYIVESARVILHGCPDWGKNSMRILLFLKVIK
jgi:hypothetical protein